VIRAVLGANIVASGVLGFDRDESPPGTILRAWFRRTFELITSDALLLEIEHTLDDGYFAPRVDARIALLTLMAVRHDATRTAITATVVGVATHPEDDLVLAAAVSAAADYLVTGDKQLLRLGSFRGVLIVSPRGFLALLAKRTDDDAEVSETQ